MRAYEIAKEAFGLWKRDIGRFIVPSAEYYLIAMLVASVLVFGIMAMMMVIMLLSIIGLMSGLFFDGGPSLFIISLLLLPFMMLLVFFVLFPIIMVIMSFVNGILNGGMSKAVLTVMSGNIPRFGDVSRTGWNDRWSFMKMELLKIAIILVVTFVPYMFTSFMLVFVIFIPFFGFLLYYLIILVLTTAIGIVTVPLHYLPYVMWWKEGRRGWDAVSSSISFMKEHWRETLGLGLLFQAANLVLMMVPGLGMVLALFGPAFLFTCFYLLYEGKRGQSLG